MDSDRDQCLSRTTLVSNLVLNHCISHSAVGCEIEHEGARRVMTELIALCRRYRCDSMQTISGTQTNPDHVFYLEIVFQTR